MCLGLDSIEQSLCHRLHSFEPGTESEEMKPAVRDIPSRISCVRESRTMNEELS
jgi:hypothetical protein